MSSNRKSKEDFEFTIDLIASFFNQQKIQKKIKDIDSIQLTGWENWIQVEFAIHLSKNDKLSFFEIEDKFPLDKRKSDNHTSSRIDVVFRRKNFSKDKIIGLEIKQKESLNACISGMIEDYKKINKLKSKNDYRESMRCCFFFGVFHSMENPISIENDIRKKLDKNGIEQKFHVVKINSTDRYWILF